MRMLKQNNEDDEQLKNLDKQKMMYATNAFPIRTAEDEDFTEAKD